MATCVLYDCCELYTNLESWHYSFVHTISDTALKIDQENRKWTLMTVCYIIQRYGGVLCAIFALVNDLYNSVVDKVNFCLISAVRLEVMLILAFTTGNSMLYSLGSDVDISHIRNPEYPRGNISSYLRQTYALHWRSTVPLYLLCGSFILAQAGNIIYTVVSFTGPNAWYTDSGKTPIEVELLSGVLVCEFRYNNESWTFLVFMATCLFYELVAASLSISRLWVHIRGSGQGIFSVWRSNSLFYIVARENVGYFCVSTACLVTLATGTTGSTKVLDYIRSLFANELRMALDTILTSLFCSHLILNVRKHADLAAEIVTVNVTSIAWATAPLQYSHEELGFEEFESEPDTEQSRTLHYQ
ncbi:hypothetical protein CONPUDRAFT_78104 [Coniophora puteana RWD-64-598 SS2]|uniref:Uncharacterized protein n=1 Tax=Coniophora puteana (strain RWD-64-598) TaxID=741705 RepID=R7SE58_CONPW|nr:uncharacterized protein CONPUDRAFT_78104 [Coniophora puteana RWD-64-598 SS2]EIW74461.1 hypothetical protein CONPUDRAFT_78104 [Coniophora puteana RWD-64-598 SS2]